DMGPDFTLLRLASLPSGRSFLPFDGAAHAAPDGTLLYRISHPGGDPQAYSVSRVHSRPAPCTEDNLPPSRFPSSDIVVGDTFPGSSGSAALLANGLVVGQLFGACGFGGECGPGQQTVDGRLAASFNQLQPFLAPGVTGACVPGDFKLCLAKR